MNIEASELSILNRLNGKINSTSTIVDIAVLPENEASFKVPYDKPRIWVSYSGGDGNALTSLSAGLSQPKAVKFDITIESRKLRGDIGVYKLISSVSSALFGFTPEHCINKLTIVKDEFIDFKENLWTYRVIVSTLAIQVEDIEEPNTPILNQATIK